MTKGSLPPYFEEFLNNKFDGVHEKIDNFIDSHNTEIKRLDEEVRLLKMDVRWAHQKLWMAIGAITIVSLAGGFFAFFFQKTVSGAVMDALIKYEIIGIQQVDDTFNN